MSLAEKLTKFTDDYQASRQKMIAEGKILFDNAVKDFFAGNSVVQRISWQQYTPYFNDGEACVFGVCEPTAFSDREGSSEDDDSAIAAYVDTDTDFYKKYPKYKESQDAQNHRVAMIFNEDKAKLDKFVQEFSVLSSFIQSQEDIMLDLFGDHTTVLITRQDDGSLSIETEEYSHD